MTEHMESDYMHWTSDGFVFSTLRWRQNGRDSVSNHQPQDCLLNRLFRCRSKKTSKLRVTGLCVGNSPGTGEFPAQMASYAEKVSIGWRHDDLLLYSKPKNTRASNIRLILLLIVIIYWEILSMKMHVMVIISNCHRYVSDFPPPLSPYIVTVKYT